MKLNPTRSLCCATTSSDACMAEVIFLASRSSDSSGTDVAAVGALDTPLVEVFAVETDDWESADSACGVAAPDGVSVGGGAALLLWPNTGASSAFRTNLSSILLGRPWLLFILF